MLPLLTKSDDKYIITNAGDEVSIDFASKTLPELKKGWKRDFLIHTVGWVKDGDLNTAYGNTVLPLPFHGMNSYPPSVSDTYPNDPEHQKYIQGLQYKSCDIRFFVMQLKLNNEYPINEKDLNHSKRYKAAKDFFASQSPGVNKRKHSKISS